MAIIVEHDKRRKQILRKALDVFIEEGFEAASYQKIADRCKITRTTLYLYFRNRQEIFNFSIKQFMMELEHDIIKVKDNPSLSHPVKIKKTLSLIFTRLEENRRLLSIVLDYLLTKNPEKQKAKKPSSGKIEILPDVRVRRRTIRLRHILSAMIITGIKTGQLKKVDIGTANDLFFSLIEAGVVRLTVFQRESIADLNKIVELIVEGLKS